MFSKQRLEKKNPAEDVYFSLKTTKIKDLIK